MTNCTSPPSIIDTHAHLDDAAFDEDRDRVVSDFRAAGVVHVLNIAYQPSSWETSQILRERYPEVDLAIGLHPQHADTYSTVIDTAMVQRVRELRPLAIGETGFDFSRSGPTEAEQRRAFRRHIEVAGEERLPLIIHQRAAVDALIEELDRWPDMAPIVLHSFDGNQRLTDWTIERGCYVGIGGLATRRASAPLRELLRAIPVERLLLETDAPYLAPPQALSRRNSPGNLPLIAGLLAPLWNVTPELLCRVTSANAAALFRFELKGKNEDGTTDDGEVG